MHSKKYMEAKLVFDTIVSEKGTEERVQKSSLTSGRVQAGERIVDRGEIITPTTYNILRSLEIVNSKRAATARQKSATLIGQILYVLILMGSIYLFLYLFRNEMFVRLRDLEVIFLMITLMIMFAALFSEFRISSIYMVPLAIVPIVIRTLLDSRVAFFSYIITVLICSLMAPFAFEFCLLQIAAGITTIISIKELSERAQLVKTAIFVLLTYAVIYVCYTLISDGSWSKINPTMFIYFGISSAMLLFAYLRIYIIEKLFGFTSSVTLV